MRVIEHEEKTMIVKTVREVKCNRCGKVIQSEVLDAIQDINLSFGYGSKYSDQKWSFDLCDDCLTDIIREFKIVPDNFMKRTNAIYLSDENLELHQELFEEWKQTGEWNEEEENYFEYADQKYEEDGYSEEFESDNNVIILEDFIKEKYIDG